MLILAIDPAAETTKSNTGWAIIDATNPYYMPEVIERGVVDLGFYGFSQWWPEIQKKNFGVVVCEQFVMYNRAADPTPLLIEGVVRYTYPATVLQPSSSLSVVSDKKLKALGLYSTEGFHRDSNSAIKHGLFYLLKQKHMGVIDALLG